MMREWMQEKVGGGQHFKAEIIQELHSMCVF